MANGKSKSARRREVRRSVPRPDPTWLSTIRQRDFLMASLYVAMIVVVGSTIALTYQRRTPHYVGEIPPKTLLARTEFQATDRDATEKNREFARRDVLPVFQHNDVLRINVRESVLGLLQLAETPFEKIDKDYAKSIKLTKQGHTLLHQYVEPDAAHSLTPDNWKERTDSLIRRLFGHAILTDETHSEVLDNARPQIKAVHPSPYEGDSAEKLYTERVLMRLTDRNLIATRLDTIAMDFQPELRDTVMATVMRQVAPTYFLNRETTETARQKAYDNEPPVKITYRPDQVLVPAGKVLSSEDLDLLRKEEKAYRASLVPAQRWLGFLGSAALIALIAIALWAYVFAYNPKAKRNPARGMALSGLMLVCQTGALLAVILWPNSVVGAAGFAAIFGAMILSIAYGQRFALGAGLAIAALIVFSLRMSAGDALVVAIGMAVAVWHLNDVRSRSKLVTVGLWSGVAMAGTAIIVGLATNDFVATQTLNITSTTVTVPIGWNLLLRNAIYSLLAGISVGMLVQGILPVIENVFHVTTAMTLKELNDASHPLLQRLAHESPGTYQHSLRIADMTEAAADAIGADGLLCRVGAMYHDIGKINKPMYFIENQGGGPNKHNKLSPAMSLLIIVGHVKDGVEMGREYNLPSVLRHFIESHHGTTLVEYFFHAAKKQTAEEDKPAPSEFEFRYPGPKPQTKEAAIMLLCDGIEGAARAMDEPTAVRLDQLVHSMANKRLMDGQFDECNLTLRELSRVEAAITKTLCAVYHTRIKYPDGKKIEPASPQPASRSA